MQINGEREMRWQKHKKSYFYLIEFIFRQDPRVPDKSI